MFSVARRKMRGPRCSEAFRWSGSIQLPPTACRLSVLDETRRHLLWKSRTREWMEMNYLLGGFVERHLPSLSMQELQQLDRLLLRKEAVYTANFRTTRFSHGSRAVRLCPRICQRRR
ncbi:unnamed protein product [Effrenium voratum]|uniref:Uncharacterized protein n=1 Tax=Effrenium voratum TaxID=2562239 RepID=A0AA36J4U1_9DINO|nr:unnamed protein product [Effrenium voratum]CAJ1437606.1 unnamed protein product [Effrenium voratum]